LKHSASPKFWARYHALPTEVRDLADKSFQLLKTNPSHPSLHLKKLSEVWSARVGLHYRAIAAEIDGDFLWVWIGTHGEYDKLRT
jgi:mRNA-degrading endonuclease RelE of RelBE toxin-antitoxin system